MWIGTKGDTKAEEIRGKRPASAQSGRILERNAVVETRSVSVTPRDASDAVLPQPVATVRPVPLTTPNILLNFHRRLCLSPPSSSYNSSLASPFALFFPSSCPPRRVLFPFSLFPLFWPSHASSLSTLSLPSVSHPPYKCFTLSHPLPNSTVTRSSPPLLLPFF
jgi:hypothetical protein